MTAMIYTTYFANLRKLPASITPISICGKAPAWFTGPQYKVLAPKYGFFIVWKNTHDNDYYVRCFNAEVLAPLSCEQVLKDLSALAAGDVALVCYEKPTDFCHRHLVSAWLREHGIPCCEWGQATQENTP